LEFFTRKEENGKFVLASEEFFPVVVADCANSVLGVINSVSDFVFNGYSFLSIVGALSSGLVPAGGSFSLLSLRFLDGQAALFARLDIVRTASNFSHQSASLALPSKTLQRSFEGFVVLNDYFQK
jgi:hypothetical protein